MIGSGAPYFAKAFQEDYAGNIRVLTDPELKTYKALQMKRSLSSSLSLRTVLRGVETHSQGFRQGKVQGDAAQQGGVYVINTQGEFLYAFNSEYAGHHPDLAEVLSVLGDAPTDGP